MYTIRDAFPSISKKIVFLPLNTMWHADAQG